MSKAKSINDIRAHKNNVLSIMDKYFESLLTTEPKKADLLAYWLHTYTNYLKFEDSFDPKRNKNYERGDIVRVNLGFNVGSEHGGRHYAVVLDKSNNHASPIVTIIPLSSSDGSDVHSSEVYLGDDIYQKVSAKIKGLRQAYRIEQLELTELQNSMQSLLKADGINEEQLSKAQANQALLATKAESIKDKQMELKKAQDEISKMKAGSVALVSQITTISKIRIEDPTNIHGALNGIKLSSENLDAIDNKISELFLKS